MMNFQENKNDALLKKLTIAKKKMFNADES